MNLLEFLQIASMFLRSRRVDNRRDNWINCVLRSHPVSDLLPFRGVARVRWVCVLPRKVELIDREEAQRLRDLNFRLAFLAFDKEGCPCLFSYSW